MILIDNGVKIHLKYTIVLDFLQFLSRVSIVYCILDNRLLLI